MTAVAPALGTDTEIRLSSSDGVAVVPAAITLPARHVVVAFTVTTRLVAADTTATISAVAGGEKREATLQVMAPLHDHRRCRRCTSNLPF